MHLPANRPFPLPRIAVLSLAAGLIAGTAACDGGKQDEKKTEAKADEAPAEPEAEAEPAAPKGLAPDAVELPWSYDDVKGSFGAGTKYVYALSGTDEKGKAVEDKFECAVKKADEAAAGLSCNRVDQPIKGAGELATVQWSKFSPMFALEKPEHTLVERTKVTVPAGEFDTVVVELKDFFGNTKKVWMVVDQPGVYAKVVELPNAGAEGDETELTYELAEVVKP